MADMEYFNNDRDEEILDVDFEVSAVGMLLRTLKEYEIRHGHAPTMLPISKSQYRQLIAELGYTLEQFPYVYVNGVDVFPEESETRLNAINKRFGIDI